MKYQTIVADPPWPYESPGGQLGSSAKHRPNSHDSSNRGPGSRKRYGAMSLENLAALPVPDLAETNAHLYLWTTNAFMVEAHNLAAAWGFKQKTILTWVKVHHDDSARVSMKVGRYFRGATEHVLFCVRGSLAMQSTEPFPTAYLWPRLPHSVKPDAFLDLVERASPGPYLEMFARRNRFGWDTWGNECFTHVELPTDPTPR